MNLEAITLKLRPRGASEAMDLGVRLLQRNAGAVYVAWGATVAPLMLACLMLAPVAPWLPTLVIWWLKPLYDRIALFVLSRAVFGQRVGVRDLDWRHMFSSGLLWSLTLGRFDFARSFNLPVYLLEGLKGKRRRARFKVLQKHTRGNAVMQTVTFVHAEQALMLSLLMLSYLFMPRWLDLPFFDWMIGKDAPMWFTLMTQGFYILVLALLEPIYVASGFTLYLNRRVELEAWDIELDLKRNLPDDEGARAVSPPHLAKGTR
ncbi:MAG: hypothetical protein JNM76_05530 [Betaproteobacteria bacterium]|nr:hypothetical protein [Betaproteobacteria bacterium]